MFVVVEGGGGGGGTFVCNSEWLFMHMELFNVEGDSKIPLPTSSQRLLINECVYSMNVHV